MIPRVHRIRRRHVLALLAFTLGALCTEVRALRRESDLRVRAECAYHEGYDDGYRSVVNIARNGGTP